MCIYIYQLFIWIQIETRLIFWDYPLSLHLSQGKMILQLHNKPSMLFGFQNFNLNNSFTHELSHGWFTFPNHPLNNRRKFRSQTSDNMEDEKQSREEAERRERLEERRVEEKE